MNNEYREPPDLTGKKLDFSEAHFLDHHVWECRKYEYAKGGWKTHLRYRWEFQWRLTLREFTFCKVGLHEDMQITAMKDRKPHATWKACANCAKPLSKRQAV